MKHSTPIHGDLRLQARALLAQEREVHATKEAARAQYEKQSILSNMDVSHALASLEHIHARFES